MRTVPRLLLVIVIMSGALVTSSVAASASKAPIRPDQHFVGLVNGRHLNAVVRVICPGPATSSLGSVASGQTMTVARVARGNGYTGLFSGVYAWFEPTKVGVRPTMLHFSTYATSVAIPRTMGAACDGTGVVEFSSCPYLRVRFVNMAV
jgi:hypothetical protein